MGLITLRNQLSFPGGAPGFNPGHFLLGGPGVAGSTGSDCFSAVASGAGFLRVNARPTGSTNSSVIASTDGLLGPCASSASGSAEFASGLVTTGTGLTLAYIGRWQTSLGLAFSVGAGTAIGQNGSGSLYLYNGGTVASMAVGSAIAASGDPVLCIASVSSNSGTKSVTFGVLNLRTGASKIVATTGTYTPLFGTANVFICNYWIQNAGWSNKIAATAAIQNFLTPGVVARWFQAPWDFWYPQTARQILFSSLAGPAPPVYVPPPPDHGHKGGNKGKGGRGKKTSKEWGPSGDLADAIIGARHTRQKRRHTVPGVTANSGTLAFTEAADSFAFVGLNSDSGTITDLEPPDAFAFAGENYNAATLSITEASDAFAFAGSNANQASFAIAEAADAFAFDGSDVNQASFAITEASDAFAFIGSDANQASFAITEAADAFAFVGGDQNLGSFAVTEAADTFAFAAANDNDASFAVTEPEDDLALVADNGNPATLEFTEASDAFSFSSANSNIASFAIVEASDAFSFSGSNLNSGTLAIIESVDGFAFLGFDANSGSLSLTEDADAFAIVGSNDNQAILSPLEPIDIFSFTGRPTIIFPPQRTNLRADRDSPSLRADRDSPQLRAGRSSS